ncbi:MAG: HAMP domain-containing sensor histidine kinase [Cyanobacteria bacterium P01_A01_bin.135]
MTLPQLRAFNSRVVDDAPSAQLTSSDQGSVLKATSGTAQFVSLRVRLLVGFSLIFSIVFAGAFYWFYTFTTDKTISRLRADLRSTLEGAVTGVDVDELMALYEDGVPNSEGFSDDPRYQNQLEWFETVKRIEPRAWLYSFIIAPQSQNRRMGPAAVSDNQLETIYLVDLWVNYDASKAVGFLESDEASSRPRVAIEAGRLTEEPNIYPDDWGTWMSAFAPLRNDEGEIVAVLGLDIEADYVFQLQDQIRNRVLLSFIVTYGILFVLIYVLSGILTRHISELTQSAEQIAAGDYSGALSSSQQQRGARNPQSSALQAGRDVRLRDEISVLAQAFEMMIESIQQREQMIRQGKKVEDEMRLALQAERELNELKSRFVSMVSHEFRTPLTVMRTSTELLEKYGHLASDEKKRDYFQRIRAAIANMTRLLEDVLVVGKAEAGKLAFNPVIGDFEQFCQEIINEMQHSVGVKHKLTLSADSVNAVHFDRDLLRPVLSNLLSNAIKYSEAGSTVETRVALAGETVTLQVSDQGIGIPKEDRPKLFQLFHRARNVDTIRGTGLGLAIVQQCITHHQGQVSFTSQEGVGTTFYVQFPASGKQEDSPSLLKSLPTSS